MRGHLTDEARLAKAPPNHLAYSFKQLFDPARLLRDQSTSNVGLNAEVVIRAHEQRRAALQPPEPNDDKAPDAA